MGKISPTEANEVLDDVLSFCAKLLVDYETSGLVRMDDLVDLRDQINEVRAAVAGGVGYEKMPRLVRIDAD